MSPIESLWTRRLQVEPDLGSAILKSLSRLALACAMDFKYIFHFKSRNSLRSPKSRDALARDTVNKASKKVGVLFVSIILCVRAQIVFVYESLNFEPIEKFGELLS